MHKPRLALLGFVVLAGLLAQAPAAQADNWPRFRGPNGTGIATNQNIPVQWGKEHFHWQIALPGTGNSSPVIWDDYMFLQTASKDAAQRSLLCLDAKTGKTKWSKSIPGGIAVINKLNTHASSTPATDGERVYTCFWDGKELVMVAYDFTGKELWVRNLGGHVSQHGAGASPILYENKVIFLNDQDGKAALIALDNKTGNTVWEAPRPFYRACYGAPFIWERKGAGKELVVVTTHEITGYNPDTGKENWRWAWKHTTKMPLRVTASPIFAGNMIFGCSGDGNGDRCMVAVDIHGNGKSAEGELAWTNKKDFPYVPCLLAHGEHLYFMNDLGLGGCYEMKTGKKVWFKRVSETKVTSSPVLIDGKIYAADESGEVYVLAASPKFEILARNSLGEQVLSTPAVAHQRLYIRGKTHLFCIGQPPQNGAK